MSSDDQPSTIDYPFEGLRFALTLVVTAVVTFFLFVPLIYYSIIAFGIPCAIFIGLGYLLWLALRGNDPQQARAFAIGFTCSVILLLFAFSIAVPWYTALITGESLCLWVPVKIVRELK
jgi:hypothetical protein